MVPRRQPPGRWAHELDGGVGEGVAVRVPVDVGVAEGGGDAEAEAEEEADFEGSEEREGVGRVVSVAVADAAPGECVRKGVSDRVGAEETEKLWPAEKDGAALRDAADAEGLADAAALSVWAGVALGKPVEDREGEALEDGEPLCTGGKEAAACGDTVWDFELPPDADSLPDTEALLELEAQHDSVLVAPADRDAEAQRVRVSVELRAYDAEGHAEAVELVEGDALDAVAEALPDGALEPLALRERRGEALLEAVVHWEEKAERVGDREVAPERDVLGEPLFEGLLLGLRDAGGEPDGQFVAIPLLVTLAVPRGDTVGSELPQEDGEELPVLIAVGERVGLAELLPLSKEALAEAENSDLVALTVDEGDSEARLAVAKVVAEGDSVAALAVAEREKKGARVAMLAVALPH